MIQVQISHPHPLPACRQCGKPPRHYIVRGKDLHLIECAPCGITSGKHPSLAQALAVWTVTESSRSCVRALRAAERV